MIVGEEEPVYMVRCMTMSVPWLFVDEFINLSVVSWPYLYPVRDSGSETYATELTNLIIARGWADRAAGPFPAKLKIPIEVLAQKFNVELENNA
jgi:hypothetical protein